MPKAVIKTIIILAFVALIPFVATTFTSDAQARDQIRAVGSSTVYPFVTVVSEEFGQKTGFKAPIVESTGTGGGFKLFCSGVGGAHPDLSNASRAIKKSEEELCAKNNVGDVTEVKIGYDGIVIANSKQSARYNLTKTQIFMALATKVPSGGALVDNPFTKWSEIDPALPDVEIRVYGPPPTSGTRDAFVELVMEKACKDLPEFKAAFPDKKQRKKACHIIREDGKYVEAGENDNLIIQKLTSNPDTLGVFGYSFLDQNLGSVQGSLVNGVEPTFENIASGEYSVSRPLFVYVKTAHIGVVDGIKEFVSELVSDDAIGEEGYLTEKGLIPMGDDERTELQKRVLDSVGN